MSAVAISKIGALGSSLQRCDKNTAWRVSGTKFHHWAIAGTYIMDGKLRRASWKICEVKAKLHAALDDSENDFIWYLIRKLR
jgi:hypothetical protein